MKPSRAWAAGTRDVTVPVCRPRLPSADSVLRYLREIDDSGWYSNHGPLTRRFEARLAEHVHAESGKHVVAACNATSALTATLRALEVPQGSLCMVPAWTFAASGHAVVQAGLVPWIVDVEASDGALRAAAALHVAGAAPARLGAVLGVSPFGRPIATHEWLEFMRQSNVPVVFDAAAAFDVVRATPIPTVVSLHATKVFGIGEGAFVTCSDSALVDEIRARINFGFVDSREARSAAMNAKLPEYSAAVGLAGLDEWPATRARFTRVAAAYVAEFRRSAAVRLEAGYGTEWVSATTIARVAADRLEALEDDLAAAGIATRRWWGGGLAQQRAFAGCPRLPVPVTDQLAAMTIGLPCAPGLSLAQIRRIAQICIAASA